MTHFNPIAFYSETDPHRDVDSVLAPFDENITVPEYVYKTKSELIADWKSRIRGYISNGTLRDKERDKYTKLLEDDDNEKIFETIKADDESINDDGDSISQYNPISKWDYYCVMGEFYPRDADGVKPIVSIKDWREIVKKRIRLVDIATEYMAENGLEDIKRDGMLYTPKLTANDLVYYVYLKRVGELEFTAKTDKRIIAAVDDLDTNLLKDETIDTPYVPSEMVFPLYLEKPTDRHDEVTTTDEATTLAPSRAITAGGMLDGTKAKDGDVLQTDGLELSEYPSIWVESAEIGWFAASGEADDKTYLKTVLSIMDRCPDDLVAADVDCHI